MEQKPIRMLTINKMPKQLKLVDLDTNNNVSILQMSFIAKDMIKNKFPNKKIYDFVSSYNIKHYVELYIDKAYNTDNKMSNVLTQNLIVIIDHLFRNGYKIISSKLYQELIRVYSIFDFKNSIEYIESDNFVIKDYQIIATSNKLIEPKKEYKNSKVFISLGIDNYKALPYNYYKKLYEIEKISFNYKIYYFDEFEDKEILLYTYVKNISNLKDLILELNHCKKIHNIIVNDVSSIMCEIYNFYDSKVNVLLKNGESVKYKNLNGFINKYFPGGYL